MLRTHFCVILDWYLTLDITYLIHPLLFYTKRNLDIICHDYPRLTFLLCFFTLVENPRNGKNIDIDGTVDCSQSFEISDNVSVKIVIQIYIFGCVIYFMPVFEFRIRSNINIHTCNGRIAIQSRLKLFISQKVIEFHVG